MRLALAVDDETGLRFDRGLLLVDRPATNTACRHIGQTILLYRRDGEQLRFFAAGRLAAIEEADGGRRGCQLRALRRFEQPVAATEEAGAPGVRRLLTLSEERYEQILAAGAPAPRTAAAEAAAAFLDDRPAVDEFLGVRAEVLRRWGYRCAVTDTQFAVGEAPELRLVPIRPRGRGEPYDLRSYLPMIELAERAWRSGAISATEEFDIVAVQSRLDPDLLEAMAPDGRLIVPDDPAHRPDPAHLAWHRTHVFGG